MSKSTPRPRSVHSPEYKRFVEMLREEREKLGLTQRALSEKLGQHHTYINLVERNIRQINVIELRQLARELRISFPDFIQRLDDSLTQMESEQDPKAPRDESNHLPATDQS